MGGVYQKELGLQVAKVLIVDDAAFFRMRLRKLLVASGHVFSEAADGEKAIEAYKTESPDIVLMDVHMPVMNGLDALYEIMKLDNKAKVVMLSNVSQQETIMKALELGARNFVVKPFDEKNLLSVIGKVLSQGV